MSRRVVRSRPGHESGKACFDGKDNDGDGVADCNDPDCKALASVYHRYCPNACQDNDASPSLGALMTMTLLLIMHA